MGMLESVRRNPALPIAAIVGLVGPAGPAGEARRYDVSSPAGTWILPHDLGRVPSVAVYLASGEAVIADVSASTTTITVTFATAQTGFVLAH
jgi:hypothetical protein